MQNKKKIDKINWSCDYKFYNFGITFISKKQEMIII